MGEHKQIARLRLVIDELTEQVESGVGYSCDEIVGLVGEGLQAIYDILVYLITELERNKNGK